MNGALPPSSLHPSKSLFLKLSLSENVCFLLQSSCRAFFITPNGSFIHINVADCVVV